MASVSRLRCWQVRLQESLSTLGGSPLMRGCHQLRTVAVKMTEGSHGSPGGGRRKRLKQSTTMMTKRCLTEPYSRTCRSRQCQVNREHQQQCDRPHRVLNEVRTADHPTRHTRVFTLRMYRKTQSALQHLQFCRMASTALLDRRDMATGRRCCSIARQCQPSRAIH